jgi:hypothetical protein
MYAEVLILRLVHILSGIIWVGSGTYTSFFLVPALSSSPAVMGQVMAGLQRRRIFLVLQIVAALTILSGLRLLRPATASDSRRSSIDCAGWRRLPAHLPWASGSSPPRQWRSRGTCSGKS